MIFVKTSYPRRQWDYLKMHWEHTMQLLALHGDCPSLETGSSFVLRHRLNGYICSAIARTCLVWSSQDRTKFFGWNIWSLSMFPNCRLCFIAYKKVLFYSTHTLLGEKGWNLDNGLLGWFPPFKNRLSSKMRAEAEAGPSLSISRILEGLQSTEARNLVEQPISICRS